LTFETPRPSSRPRSPEAQKPRSPEAQKINSSLDGHPIEQVRSHMKHGASSVRGSRGFNGDRHPTVNSSSRFDGASRVYPSSRSNHVRASQF
jgi:hypothetical protein